MRVVTLKDMWRNHQQQRLARTPILQQSVQNYRAVRDRLFAGMPDGVRAFIFCKWRLDSLESQADPFPRRPRTVGEVAATLGLTTEQVVITDTRITAIYRDLSIDPYDYEWLGIPIERAQGWWDQKYAEDYFPDGVIRGTCETCGTSGEVLRFSSRASCDCGRSVKVRDHIMACECRGSVFHAWTYHETRTPMLLRERDS